MPWQIQKLYDFKIEMGLRLRFLKFYEFLDTTDKLYTSKRFAILRYKQEHQTATQQYSPKHSNIWI